MLAINTVATSNSEVVSWSTDRQWMDQLLHQHLHRAKNRMKRQADRHRSERGFDMGDLVLLKLQPYVQSSLAPRSHQKLAFHYFGPFRVLARVGSIAYRLELPSHSAIHLVFHVSQLKKVIGAAGNTHTTF